ncbi:hypothetical protein [Azospirillum sp. B4]|uniref:hypothetical protein n=1 Tax=Azospirillum sp. B4 TaxID=95605 RepID=UPI0011DD2D59|nr:hypothetical protein [Azospirillum sp. B4]
MKMRWLCLAMALVFCALPVLTEAKQRAFFDKPVKNVEWKKGELTITCTYYRDFMVKEIGDGGKGSISLAIVKRSHAGLPACRFKIEDEREVEDWSGYFAAAKGNYLFFSADDGDPVGNAFAIVDGNTGKVLFYDDAQVGVRSIHSLKIKDDGIVLRYRRAFRTPCSLYARNASCWEAVKQAAFMAPDTRQPNCDVVYAGAETDPRVRDDPSVIDYEVEVTLTAGKARFTGLPGKVECWAED